MRHPAPTLTGERLVLHLCTIPRRDEGTPIFVRAVHLSCDWKLDIANIHQDPAISVSKSHHKVNQSVIGMQSWLLSSKEYSCLAARQNFTQRLDSRGSCISRDGSSQPLAAALPTSTRRGTNSQLQGPLGTRQQKTGVSGSGTVLATELILIYLRRLTAAVTSRVAIEEL